MLNSRVKDNIRMAKMAYCVSKYIVTVKHKLLKGSRDDFVLQYDTQ